MKDPKIVDQTDEETPTAKSPTRRLSPVWAKQPLYSLPSFLLLRLPIMIFVASLFHKNRGGF
jgi:hypothetical protein